MNTKSHVTALLLAAATLPALSLGSSDDTAKSKEGRSGSSYMSMRQFLAEVAAENLDYAAQRFNVSIAEAQLVAARVSPNPTLTLGGARDVTSPSSQKLPSTPNVGLTQTLELGGQRGARTTAASINVSVTQAALEDFFRNLRASAANAYIDAVSGRLSADQKHRSADALAQLAEANRKRLELGDVGEVDYNQAAVDALQARNDFFSATSTAQSANIALSQFLGTRRARETVILEDRLDTPDFGSTSESDLIAGALVRRPDLRAARGAVEAARAGVRLAQANRIPNLDVGATFTHNSVSNNPIAPSPSWDSLGLTFAFPLPIFNSFRGEYLTAERTLAQTQKTAASVEQRVITDVRQSLARYRVAQQRVSIFQSKGLAQAEQVYQARLQSYRSGASTLLDVLNAQKVANDVHLAYIDALTERAKAWVALCQSTALSN